MAADLFSDTVDFHLTALDVALACSADRQQRRLEDFHVNALEHASDLIAHAISGQQIKQSWRLSSTPARDLEALDYAQRAFRTVFNEQDGPQFADRLDQMREALATTVADRKFPSHGEWTRDNIDRIWRAIFWASLHDASAPTDVFVVGGLAS